MKLRFCNSAFHTTPKKSFLLRTWFSILSRKPTYCKELKTSEQVEQRKVILSVNIERAIKVTLSLKLSDLITTTSSVKKLARLYWMPKSESEWRRGSNTSCVPVIYQNENKILTCWRASVTPVRSHLREIFPSKRFWMKSASCKELSVRDFLDGFS